MCVSASIVLALSLSLGIMEGIMEAGRQFSARLA